ncbi:ubiquitin-like-specific protease 1C isoform X2 [Rutidosis leptorrhynchoides]|uniref:ubiquitin-like-specific protease 1C isoform X2 n=1 Tax=Rutidosis leptorrhynchoides TaxID=125765 RepID=UPI003A9A49C9
MMKTDGEINEFISRQKRMEKISYKLPDRGEKLKATVRRYEAELERRNQAKLTKVENGSKETIQLSDHSDDGGSCGNKKGGQNSASASRFTKRFLSKLMEDQDSRTVNAFEKDLCVINPCQGRKVKLKTILGKGGSKTGLSRPVDSKRQIISDDDKKDGDSTTAKLEPNSPKDTPSRNLRPRQKRSYHLVDEDIETTLQYVEKLDPSMKDVKVYYPSRDDPDPVEVNSNDMECLLPEACLSSTIINFYIRYLQQPTPSSESSTSSYHFFNTYFYNKLAKLSYKEDSFLKFRKWWKGVSLFEKAFIVLPVHESAHWSLVIICVPTKADELGPILLHFDSLGLHDSTSLFDNIKRFLKEEWNYLRKSEAHLNIPIADEIWETLDRRMDHKRVMVPQQKNEYDCGLFILFYLELFIKKAPERFRKKDLSMFGKQWFRAQEASKSRVKIYDLLVQEFKKAKKANECSPSPEI